MLDYLISLLDDANDFSWTSAKASHAVLLCRMEQGEIKDYTQTEHIGSDAHMHTPTGQDTQKNVLKRHNSKSMVCQYYISGICSQQS